MSRRISRRRLFRDGGLVAGAAAVGSAGVRPASAAGQGGERERPNGILIVTSGTRADKIGIYEDAYDDAKAYDTPNIDALGKDSLRFEHATPESIGGVPGRRALISGHRSFPYRDWTLTEGLAPYPGWNQPMARWPLVTEVLRENGVETAWVTDNAAFEGARYADIRSTMDFTSANFPAAPRDPGTVLDAAAARRDIERYLIPSIERSAEAAERVIDRGMELLGELSRKTPFFLAVDAFDPAEAFDAPRVYRRRTSEPDLDGALFNWVVEADFDDAAIALVREVYEDRMRFVDGRIGKFLDRVDDLGLRENTVVTYVSDGGTMLGEQDSLGKGAPSGYLDGWWIPFMVRDPQGRRKGGTETYFASTFDVAPTFLSMMDIVIPGRMMGNDLSAFFEDADHEPFPRAGWLVGAVSNIAVGERRFILLSDREGENRRLYDNEVDDDATWDDEDDYYDKGDNVIRARPDVADRMWPWVMAIAEGTLPEFGEDAPTRPGIEDDDVDDDGIDDDDETSAEGPERDLDSVDEDFDDPRGDN